MNKWDPDAADRMSIEFVAYCTQQGLPEMSAEELIHEDLTPEQRQWVSDFIVRWNVEVEGQDPEDIR